MPVSTMEASHHPYGLWEFEYIATPTEFGNGYRKKKKKKEKNIQQPVFAGRHRPNY